MVREVKSGQNISAKVLNEVIRDTNQARHPSVGGDVQFQDGPGGGAFSIRSQVNKRQTYILGRVHNAGSMTIEPYFPAAILEPTNKNINNNATEIYLDVTALNESVDADDRFVVAQERILPGTMGLAILMGVCLCKVSGELADFAIATGGVSYLSLSEDGGPAEVLWADTGSGVRNAIIRFPTGSGGGLTIKTFTKFPPIPTKPTVIDCKNELWYARSGYTVWKPATSFTDASGVPNT